MTNVQLGDEYALARGIKNLLLTSLTDAPQASAIVVGPMDHLPQDEGIGLRPSAVTDDSDTGNAIVEVQVRFRANIDDGYEQIHSWRKQALALLPALRMVEINGVHVTTAWRERAADLGYDTSNRLEFADRYYFRTDRLAMQA